MIIGYLNFLLDIFIIPYHIHYYCKSFDMTGEDDMFSLVTYINISPVLVLGTLSINKYIKLDF